ncbi:MAG: hypothetical protein WC295_00470 [Methanoregula sp.]|jgi:hypothetical protein
MSTIFDAMPLKVLQELERMETSISDLEHRAFVFQANAQDLRIRHEDIIASWKVRAERDGLENLVAERHRLEAITWIFDPLPSGVAAEARGRVR